MMPARARSSATIAAFTFGLVCSCADGGAGTLGPPNGMGGAAGSPSSAGSAGVSVSGGSVGTSGASGTTSSAGQQSGAGGAGAGGASAGAGGSSSGGSSGAGGSGGNGGVGGTSGDGWVPIFNGKDLTGWFPKIHNQPYKTDPYNTFKVADGAIKVSYESYPNSSDFGGNTGLFGLLYYDKLLTNYRVRVEYRFSEPQAKNPPGWGKNNSGLMVFGLDPSKIQGEPSFPPLLEIQLLGNPSGGGDTSPNLCKPGGYTVTLVNGQPPSDQCDKAKTPPPAPPPGDWITVEAEVHVNGDTKVFQYPNMTTPALTFSGPKTNGGEPLTGGYLSLQSESQPCEFRKVELMELAQ